MKGILRTLLCFLLIAAASFSSCKKYPEGPFVSLRSKKDRLANLWTVDNYIENGVDETAEYLELHADQVWRFGKDNSFDVYETVGAKPVSRSGDWTFSEDKKVISMLNQASDSFYYFRILRLLEKELWLRQTDSLTGNTREFRFSEKTQ